LINGKDAHLKNVHSVQSELLRLLSGMDYCLDWKPDPYAWSARQVVYHVLDSPPGGIHQVLWGMISGDLDEFELWASLDNMTPTRSTYDLEQIREDIIEFFHGMEAAIEAADEGDFDEKSILARLRSQGVDETRTLRMLLEGIFDRHWRQHLEHIRELREGLGM
jgi:hypothetical protein